MCRSGGRSMQVAQFLARNGFENVANLTGRSSPGPAMWIRQSARINSARVCRNDFRRPCGVARPTDIVIYNTDLIRRCLQREHQ